MPYLFPFPELRYAWGTDILWSEIALQKKLKIGIIDATPIEHLRPIGQAYDVGLAIEEAKSFLRIKGIKRSKRELLKTVETIQDPYKKSRRNYS